MTERRPSAEELLTERRRAAARKYNDLSREFGLLFDGAQQETFEQWLALDEEPE